MIQLSLNTFQILEIEWYKEIRNIISYIHHIWKMGIYCMSDLDLKIVCCKDRQKFAV